MPERSSYLSERDIVNLRKSAPELLTAFMSDYPDTLPSAIIYPETSARVLFYIFDASFERLAKVRGCQKPLSFFFKVCTHDRDLDTALIMERFQGKDILTINEEYHSELNILQAQLACGQNKPRIKERITSCEFQLEMLKEIDKICLFRKASKKRADEIKNYLVLAGRSFNVAIFDEFVYGGYCINEVRKAFGDSNIPAYVLMSGNEERFLGRVQPVKTGIFFSQSYLHEQDPNCVAFDWRGRGSKRALGVEKNSDPSNSYVQVIKGDWVIEPKARLRTEMREIGEELVSSLYPQYIQGRLDI